MELRHYGAVLWRWAWLVAVGTLLAAAAAFGASSLMTPVYSAATTLLVNQAAPSTLVTDYTTVLTSQQLAKTYSELIKKRPILQAAIDNLQLKFSPEELLRKLQVTPVRDTTLITVGLEDEDPQLAAATVNEIGKVFIQQMNEQQHSRFAASEDNLAKELDQLRNDMTTAQQSLDKVRSTSPQDVNEGVQLQALITQDQNNYATLLKSYEDLRVTEARSLDSVSVSELAAVPDKPVRPQILLNTVVAAVLGAILAIGTAFLIEYMDDTIKSPEDARESLSLTTMGIIAKFDHKGDDMKNAVIVASNPRSPISEAFRTLRTNIQFASLDSKIRTILITSPGPGEGKSLVAANLAAALAQAGEHVTLMDGDLRRPSVHRLMSLPNSIGLTSAAINGNGKLNGSLQNTEIDNLKALPSGPLPPNPAELLGSGRVARLVDELKSEADVVIIDSPPALLVTDPAVLAKRVDAVIMVLETGSTRREAARQALASLQQVGANVVGVVLNKLTPRSSGYHGYHYYHNYYYYSATGEKKRRPAAKSATNAPRTENSRGPQVNAVREK